MPKYLFQASYTVDGLRGLLKDTPSGRRDAVQKAMKSAGGKLEAFYYCFGKQDVMLIAELPDNATAAGFVVQACATGMVKITTTPLLTVTEADKGMKAKANYRAPGSGK